jgi:tetraacyldisaccharide 4'-kinase
MIGLLWPLALVYRWIVSLRVALYHRGWLKGQHLPGIVISVGNIEVGGTGKSPLVMALATCLVQSGARPVVLTRGYRSGLGPDESAVLHGSELLLTPQQSSSFHADEARMQAQRLREVPVIVGRRRYAAARRYLHHFPAPSHWILDDGFQHLQLERDCDIVLLDADRPFDNGQCLPVGRLREHPSALKRAQLVVFTRANAKRPSIEVQERIESWGVRTLRVAFQNGEPRQVAGPEQAWRAVKRWSLAIGIARPERVIQNLPAWGIKLQHCYRVQDHSAFEPARLRDIARGSDALLTTEKDYWRDPALFDQLAIPVYYLPLDLAWTQAESLPNFLREFNLL